MGKSVISFKVPGGLGNQLFAYYCALYTTQRCDSEVELDFSSVDRSHYTSSIPLLSMDSLPSQLKIKNASLQFKTAQPKMLRINKLIRHYFQRRDTKVFLPGSDSKAHFDEFLEKDFPNIQGSITVEGYFGDFSFFDAVQPDNRSVAVENPSDHFLSLKEDFESSAYVAVHHRLGDFLGLANSVGLLDKQYYETAFRYSKERGINEFRVFTNDLMKSRAIFQEWNFSLDEMSWIDTNNLPNPLENILLMGSSRGLISSNSTFSFWASKLAEKSCTNIFYPADFRRDRLTEIRGVPSSWTPIKSSWVGEGHG